MGASWEERSIAAGQGRARIYTHAQDAFDNALYDKKFQELEKENSRLRKALRKARANIPFAAERIARAEAETARAEAETAHAEAETLRVKLAMARQTRRYAEN